MVRVSIPLASGIPAPLNPVDFPIAATTKNLQLLFVINNYLAASLMVPNVQRRKNAQITKHKLLANQEASMVM